MVEKLSKQLRPPPLPTPLRTMNVWQRLLTVLKICSHSSVVTNLGFWLHVAVWKEGLSLQPHKQIGTTTWLNRGQWRVTATRTFQLPSHVMGLGGCQRGQGHMQWSNNKRERVWVPTPWRFTLAMGLIMGIVVSPQNRYVLTPVSSKCDCIWK